MTRTPNVPPGFRRTRMNHPALKSGSVAVVTGGAAGIGLAAAKRFAQLGLRVCIADLGSDRLARAVDVIGTDEVMTLETDVSRVEDLRRLEEAVRDRFGGTD